MAKLYFRYGVMGSSKTANALMVRYNYEERGQEALLVKPELAAGAKNVVVIGGDELEKGVVKLRDMENSVEAEVARDKINEILLEMKGE